MHLERTQAEVPRLRRGRPSYAWVTRYYVVTDTGREYPPVPRAEAFNRLRELGHKGPVTIK